MQFYSTNNPNHRVSAREATLRGLAPDGGLYMPCQIPESSHPMEAFFSDDVPADVLTQMTKEALNFPLPLVQLTSNISVLELWHGPTLAFKDVGARFMARLLSYFVQQNNEEVTILVATSGDTGSAVAQGFFGLPGIRVVILYPKGKVSHIQEQQLTTIGGNVTALEIDGVFDDCQHLVKQAFVDQELTTHLHLTSANSINIARWIPQSLYYFSLPPDAVVSVPSGNFGNLAAGLLAKRMGAKISRFIAATNANDVVPAYLANGIFEPRPSIPTISNAMDVGNPSNLSRITALYPDLHDLRQDVVGISVSDDQTKQTIKEVYKEYNYVLDPHGAVGYAALKQHLSKQPEARGVFLATAHPAKFLDVVEPCIGRPIAIPDRLAACLSKEKQALPCSTNFTDFKNMLLSLFS